MMWERTLEGVIQGPEQCTLRTYQVKLMPYGKLVDHDFVMLGLNFSMHIVVDEHMHHA
jgi:hypothetical protein